MHVHTTEDLAATSEGHESAWQSNHHGERVDTRASYGVHQHGRRNGQHFAPAPGRAERGEGEEHSGASGRDWHHVLPKGGNFDDVSFSLIHEGIVVTKNTAMHTVDCVLLNIFACVDESH